MRHTFSITLLLTTALCACSGDDASTPTSSDFRTEIASSALPLGAIHELVLNGRSDVFGVISADQRTYPDGSIHSSATATFRTRLPSDGICTVETVGDCSYQLCPEDFPPPQPIERLGAGNVRLAGAKQAVLLVPDENNIYPYLSFDGALWNTKDKLAWVISGDAPVIPPAHQQQDAPLPFTLVGSLPTEVDRAQDLVLEWDVLSPPGGAGNAQMGVYAASFSFVPGAPSAVSCTVPIENGEVELPAEALAVLPDGPALLLLQSQNEISVPKDNQWLIYQLIGDAAGEFVDIH